MSLRLGLSPQREQDAQRDEVTGGWRKLHNEEVHYLYSSQNIITMIKSSRMRWLGHIVRMERIRNA
jgi:hypothetical protein